MYTLAGLEREETGWGVAGETFAMLSMLEAYGGNAWFQLGGRDLATHILRTHRLRAGENLTEITSALAGSLGIPSRVLPMCDEPVATIVETPEGPLEFQDYFVRRRQRDEVLGVRLRGIENARAAGAVSEALAAADAVVLCPSNPVVSIGPLVAVRGMREALTAARAPKVAVSPIVGGRALKGPADRMLRTLGHEVSALGVARMYEGLLNGFVLDRTDEQQADAISALGMRPLVADAVMRDGPDRERLARVVLGFCGGLR